MPRRRFSRLRRRRTGLRSIPPRSPGRAGLPLACGNRAHSAWCPAAAGCGSPVSRRGALYGPLPSGGGAGSGTEVWLAGPVGQEPVGEPALAGGPLLLLQEPGEPMLPPPARACALCLYRPACPACASGLVHRLRRGPAGPPCRHPGRRVQSYPRGNPKCVGGQRAFRSGRSSCERNPGPAHGHVGAGPPGAGISLVANSGPRADHPENHGSTPRSPTSGSSGPSVGRGGGRPTSSPMGHRLEPRARQYRPGLSSRRYSITSNCAWRDSLAR